jgi:6-phosphogluconolactonase (cycloisomerase 2 family)
MMYMGKHSRWLVTVFLAILLAAWSAEPAAAATPPSFVYALRQVDGGANQIYGFRLDPVSGALTALSGFPVATGGTGDDIDLIGHVTYTGGRLFVINQGSNSLSVFAVNQTTGALTAMPFSPIALAATGDLPVCVLAHPSGSPVVVVFNNPGVGSATIRSWMLTSTAASAGTSVFAGTAAPLSCAMSRDGSFLYEGGLSGSGIGGFNVNASSGVVTPLAGSPFDSGEADPAGLATDSAGRLFVAHHHAPHARVFTTSGGIPSPVTGNPFPSGVTFVGLSVVHPSGFYLVPASDGGVGVYRISGSGSSTTLSAVSGSPFSTGGSVPFNLAKTNDGAQLIAANAFSRNLAVFSVNSGTGSLTTLGVQPANTLGPTGRISGLAIAPGFTLKDFDSDLKGDLLLRNRSTGQNIGWLMNGLSVSTSAFLPSVVDTNWEVRGLGDFDGDAKADVVLRNKSTGQNVGWLMNGLTISDGAFLPTIADTNWEIKGVGDFNGDEKADIILRNKSTGQNIGWLMNGLAVSTSAFLPTVADTNWEIVGVGDLDGNGKADVVLRNKSTGQNIGWLMNGLTVSTSAFLPTIADTNWEIVGVGDFSGEGKADMVLRNKSNGQNIVWLMNGLTVSSSAFLPTIADTNWEIRAIGDFNADGQADMILHNKSTGHNIGWNMNGLTISFAAFLPTIADTNWDFVGSGSR